MNLTRRNALQAVMATGLSSTLGGKATAQSGKTLRVLLGYPPGGAVDVVARAVCDALRPAGYTVVVENRTGAAGRLATEQMLAAPADGSTLVFMPGGNATIFPYVYANLKYDPFKDLVPVAAVTEFTFALGVGPGTPAKTLKEFVDWAKANPGKASYGTPGGGTAMHFMGVMFARAAGFEFAHVPYRGGAAAIVDVMGGTVPALATTLPNLVQPHRQGRIRILAFTGDKRLPALPDVPTFKESGYPSLEMTENMGFFASAKTPAPVVDELHRVLRAAAAQPGVINALERLEFDPVSMTRAQYATKLRTDYERWGPVIKATGYKAED